MHLRLLPTLGAVLIAAASASAEEQLCKNAPRDMWLSKEQIKAKVEAMGYTKVRIGTEHGCYEAHATRTASGWRSISSPPRARWSRPRAAELGRRSHARRGTCRPPAPNSCPSPGRL